DGTVKRYPVTGAVLVDGRPLLGKTGAVVFKPDATKGNTSAVTAAGELDAEGQYLMRSTGRKGVPPGWDKVIVTAAEPGDDRAVRPRPTVNPRYASDKTTPLAVEVVADPPPGRYDLALKK